MREEQPLLTRAQWGGVAVAATLLLALLAPLSVSYGAVRGVMVLLLALAVHGALSWHNVASQAHAAPDTRALELHPDITDLSRANLNGASLQGVRLRGAQLREVSFQRAKLRGAQLSQVSARGLAASGADLSGAALDGADLRGADLSRANLGGADLTGADLTDADLRGADLRATNLSGATLTDARLEQAQHDMMTSWPEGYSPPEQGAPLRAAEALASAAAKRVERAPGRSGQSTVPLTDEDLMFVQLPKAPSEPPAESREGFALASALDDAAQEVLAADAQAAQHEDGPPEEPTIALERAGQ